MMLPESARRLSNPSPIKPRRNGSLPNVFNNGVNETPRLIRTPSNPQHSQLSKKESIISSNSTQSDNSGMSCFLFNVLSIIIKKYLF